MAGEHEFEFETDIRPAQERDESVTRDTDHAVSTDVDATETTSSPQIEPGNGVVAALRSKFDAETHAARPANETQLLLVGTALITYDAWTLSELVKKADADPDQPAYVEELLPFARRLVERYGF